MRTAIISDIHANLYALRAFITAAERLHVQRTLCLGDVVGYNPWPNECVRIIMDNAIPCIMGNHDRVAAGLVEPDEFNAMAREAILWTRRVITEEHRSFLEALSDRNVIDDSTIMVHGSPRDPDEYILTTSIAQENMVYMKQEMGASLGFFGHTHVQGIFNLTDGDVPVHDGKVDLRRENICLINPGSIGQPRDGQPGASFLVHDDEKKTVEFFRVEYDINSVYEAIIREGLPPYLGKRLFLGA